MCIFHKGHALLLQLCSFLRIFQRPVGVPQLQTGQAPIRLPESVKKPPCSVAGLS